MTNIINDISTLTTIPVKTWNKLVKKTNYCICDAVLENTLIDEDITAVDLGIGVLYIKRADLEGNIIKYRFEPSPALDKAIKDTIIKVFLQHHDLFCRMQIWKSYSFRGKRFYHIFQNLFS